MHREASPGKLGAFEEELFRTVDMTDVPVVAALLLGYSEGARIVGIAFADAAGRRLGACEFADDEYFCSTEAVLLQLGAKEVVLPKVLHAISNFSFPKVALAPCFKAHAMSEIMLSFHNGLCSLAAQKKLRSCLNAYAYIQSVAQVQHVEHL